jgi:transcriptional regulator with XRE-family HTH domain
MVTSLGRFLRKLRIDRGEILKDMADKLEVSSSFLSAVENGKKRMPSAWNNEIVKLYQLEQESQNMFTKAIAETEESVEMDFSNASFNNRELAISFARKFVDFDDEQVEEIKKILGKGKKLDE